MNMYGSLFDDVSKCFSNLLTPFEELIDYFNDIFQGFAYIGDTSAMERILKKDKKIYAKHLDSMRMLHLKRFAIPKVIPRNLPYQRRVY